MQLDMTLICDRDVEVKLHFQTIAKCMFSLDDILKFKICNEPAEMQPKHFIQSFDDTRRFAYHLNRYKHR